MSYGSVLQRTSIRSKIWAKVTSVKSRAPAPASCSCGEFRSCCRCCSSRSRSDGPSPSCPKAWGSPLGPNRLCRVSTPGGLLSPNVYTVDCHPGPVCCTVVHPWLLTVVWIRLVLLLLLLLASLPCDKHQAHQDVPDNTSSTSRLLKGGFKVHLTIILAQQ